MTFKSSQTHTEQIFIDLQILNITKLNDYLTSLLMFRYHHLNNLATFFTNFFITNKKIHKYNTRNSSKFHEPHQRTNYAKHSLSVKGVSVWNNLDSSLTTISAHGIFTPGNPKYTSYITNSMFYITCTSLTSLNVNRYVALYFYSLYYYINSFKL